MAVQGELFVDTKNLDDLGAFLNSLNTTLTDSLTTLKTEFGKITSSWKDADGAELKKKYDDFITSAEELLSQIESLSSIAQTASTDYEAAVNKAIASMV